MKRGQICITKQDRERLEALLASPDVTRDHDRQDLQDLRGELARAKIVAPAAIPPDVVTMNSKVVLRDLDTDEATTYRLVFPRDANVDAGAISILAPVGTAILGFRKGDVIEWRVPSGTRRLRVEEVLYQPEAAGDFHL